MIGPAGQPDDLLRPGGHILALHNDYLTPVIAATAITVSAALASRYYAGEAWAFIPRRRQETDRRVPVMWVILQASLTTGAMLLGLVMVLSWITARDFPAEVSAVTVGILIGIVVSMAVTMIWNLTVPSRLCTEQTSRLAQVTAGLVLTAGIIYASIALPPRALTENWQARDVLLGVAVILGIQICWSLIVRLPLRRHVHCP